MTHQIFTASYHGDAQWYRFSLQSMKKFCVGFLPPVVCVSKADEAQFRAICDEVYPETTVAVLDGSGVSRAQVAMLRVDEMCPSADILWLMGSDCTVSSEMRPEPFLHTDGRPVMLYNTYHHLLQHAPGVMPWKIGTERILGFKTPVESMRRVPTLATPELYRRTREHIEKLHGKLFDKFIVEDYKQHKNTSETNIIGSYAWEFMRDAFHWENMDHRYEEVMRKYPNPVLQWWSHAGVDAVCDRDMKYPGGSTLRKRPRQVIKEILG